MSLNSIFPNIDLDAAITTFLFLMIIGAVIIFMEKEIIKHDFFPLSMALTIFCGLPLYFLLILKKTKGVM